jgi:hypothetical protein
MGVKDLIPKKKRPELVELLKTHSFAEAGDVLGLEKVLKNKTNVRNTIRRVWEDIKEKPEDNGVSREKVKEVHEILDMRRINKGGAKKQVITPLNNSLAEVGFKDLVSGVQDTRDATLMLVRKKLNLLNSDKEQLKKMNLATLTTAFGILFDKSQIAKGEATEHIAIHAKISQDMSPEDRIAAIAKIREEASEK